MQGACAAAEDHDGFARGSRHGGSRKREYAEFVAARAASQPGGLALSGGMVVATEWRNWEGGLEGRRSGGGRVGDSIG
jgi:hypothetical protein